MPWTAQFTKSVLLYVTQVLKSAGGLEEQLQAAESSPRVLRQREDSEKRQPQSFRKVDPDLPEPSTHDPGGCERPRLLARGHTRLQPGGWREELPHFLSVDDADALAEMPYLQLEDASKYKFLKQAPVAMNDEEEFKALLEAFNTLNFNSEKEEHICRIAAGNLHMGKSRDPRAMRGRI